MTCEKCMQQQQQIININKQKNIRRRELKKEGLKQCTQCTQIKNIEEFPLKYDKRNPLLRRSICNLCVKIKQKEYYQKRKSKSQSSEHTDE